MREEVYLNETAISELFFDKIHVESYSVRLRFNYPVTFHYYHGSKLYAFISALLGIHSTPAQKQKVNDIVIYPCESGRITYKPGDEYVFQITFLNNIKNIIEKFKVNIDNIPDINYSGDLNNKSIELVELKKISFPEYKPLKNDVFTLKFITPLRLERKEEDKCKGGTLFDTKYFDGQQFFKLLYKRAADLYKLNTGSYPFNDVPQNPEVEIIDKYFIWVDSPKDANKLTLGGIIGYVTFKAELNDLWKGVLHFGQIMHAGKSSSAGFGKYVIQGTDFGKTLIKPAKSYFHLVTDRENLLIAFKHVKSNSDFPGVDNVTPELYESDLENNINNLISSLTKGDYKPEALKGIIIPKTDKKIRALAVPAIKDRILQRAVVQVIGDSIEHLLEENSFAYRKGFSRSSAAYAIVMACKNGYKYVLKSDISSFFDNVNWEILFKKIDILFSEDPIVKLIKEWVSSDVIYKGIRIKRSKGLPQGAVISPLLANLYLDEFDETLQDNFKLIRYADDFVILCKSIELAQKALEETKAALAKLKLDINLSKTRLTSFEEGFQYLGYLFINSLVLDKEKKDGSKTITDTSLVYEPENLPNTSWITLVDLNKIKTLSDAKSQKIVPLTKNEVGELLLERYPLYITNNCNISIDVNNIELTFEDNPKVTHKKYPLQDISSIVIFGYSKISMPAVFKLNEYNIPIYFCKQNGELKLSIPLAKPDYSVWANQLQLANDNNFCLKFSAEIVKAKINNYKVIARRTLHVENSNEIFNSFIEKINRAESLESLRGIEGSAASRFFDILNSSLSDEWKFENRNKRPPRDPVNSMLSFGYSILYHHISTALQIEGLNPQIGFFHRRSDRYFPLASDIQEEFRHIIDSLIIYLIHRNMVTKDDFIININNLYPCLMTKEFRKKFIAMVEERLKTEFTPLNFSRKVSYREFIVFQAKSIKKTVIQKELKYNPLWIR
ncbi:MAG: CRISPR-associated endonuclease Cas1 [Candidatus Aenigmatarchaeota archaeon]